MMTMAKTVRAETMTTTATTTKRKRKCPPKRLSDSRKLRVSV